MRRWRSSRKSGHLLRSSSDNQKYLCVCKAGCAVDDGAARFFWNPARAESFNLQSEVPAECLRALKLNALVFRNF